MGFGPQFDYASPEYIWQEIRQVWPEGAGISYARLEAGGLQWPCRDEQDGGQEILHADVFACGIKASLKQIDYTPTPETVSPEFPFLLMTGRSLYQFNVGNMSRRTPNVQLRPTDSLTLSPADAARLGMTDGQMARVTSRYGNARLPLHIDSTVSDGQAFATFHDPQVHINRVTGPYRDSIVGAPEYKVTAVTISGEAGPPSPKTGRRQRRRSES